MRKRLPLEWQSERQTRQACLWLSGPEWPLEERWSWLRASCSASRLPLPRVLYHAARVALSRELKLPVLQRRSRRAPRLVRNAVSSLMLERSVQTLVRWHRRCLSLCDLHALARLVSLVLETSLAARPAALRREPAGLLDSLAASRQQLARLVSRRERLCRARPSRELAFR